MTKDNTDKLFQIIGTETYGKVLATNSAGKYVFEEKGSNKLLTLDKGKVEEVFPYTISVQFEKGGKHYHYFSEKGKVSVGDLIIISNSGSIATVVGIETKSDTATKDLTGRKVMTQVI